MKRTKRQIIRAIQGHVSEVLPPDFVDLEQGLRAFISTQPLYRSAHLIAAMQEDVQYMAWIRHDPDGRSQHLELESSLVRDSAGRIPEHQRSVQLHLAAEFDALRDIDALVFTEYQHGDRNPYRSWLGGVRRLEPKAVVRFLCFWYPVSRCQPQILLRCAAAYSNRADRRLMMQNYLEEDGLVRPGDDAHYDLLEQLIEEIGGPFQPDPEAQRLVGSFHDAMNKMTPAQATGFMAGIEHPALDISAYFQRVIELCRCGELVNSDPYLTIHVDVEPDHIIWSHGNALAYMKGGAQDEVVRAFQTVMTFWQKFWAEAFTRLDYPKWSRACESVSLDDGSHTRGCDANGEHFAS